MFVIMSVTTKKEKVKYRIYESSNFRKLVGLIVLGNELD